VPGWSGPDVTSGRPVRFVAENGGPILRAAVLDKTTGDHHALLLVVSQLGGEILATAPLGELDVGGTRELLSHLAPWRFAPGSTGVRIDLSVFERAAPRRFAVKSLLVAVAGNQARVVLDRLVESGDDARDRRATLVARDDGQLVVEERESGQPRPRTLTYRLGKDGVYETGDVSIFDAR
jgi:hypothetical protein